MRAGKNFIQTKTSNATGNPNITNNFLSHPSFELENDFESRFSGENELTDCINSKIMLLNRVSLFTLLSY